MKKIFAPAFSLFDVLVYVCIILTAVTTVSHPIWSLSVITVLLVVYFIRMWFIFREDETEEGFIQFKKEK